MFAVVSPGGDDKPRVHAPFITREAAENWMYDKFKEFICDTWMPEVVRCESPLKETP
jgi:hypothetical protein